VSQQYDALSIKANHALVARTHGADTDEEALWEDFIAEFKRAFAEPLWQVFARLEHLRMAGDEVELYIATFNNLMRRTGYQGDGGTMVPYFRQGLPINLLRSIMKQQTIPNTIDEWQSAAREAAESQALMKFYRPARPEGGDTDAAQTGVISHPQLSEEEIARFMTEGRCFKCGGKGHRARDCSEA